MEVDLFPGGTDEAAQHGLGVVDELQGEIVADPFGLEGVFEPRYGWCAGSGRPPQPPAVALKTGMQFSAALYHYSSGGCRGWALLHRRLWGGTMEQKVLVYYTGGTIGMTATPPRDVDPSFERNMRAALQNVRGIPAFDFRARSRPLDSSNMTPKDWKEIADFITAQHDNYRAFVILHGTDTMAYTTSALTFMIQGLRKPVIFTGSQVPLAVPVPDSDALFNLASSLRIAGDYKLRRPEVCLFFRDRLLRGCRATKVSSEEWEAFDSPNFGPLARTIGDRIEFNEQTGLPPEEDFQVAALHVQEFTHTEVGLLRLFPGISDVITRNFLQSPLEGAVLHAYGSGNGPGGSDENSPFRVALRQAVARGAVLVACTQCLRGSVDLSLYRTGLGREGVISGYDMTAEAALTKLVWLLSLGLNRTEVRRRMERNERGELTPPPR